MKPYYAMMVDLRGKPCLVVGGGRVAERKTVSLLEAGADVRLVSPVATPMIREWAEAGMLRWEPRPYRTGDGDGCLLVLAATDREDVNRQVHHDAMARGQWVNVADQPALCNFTVPSMVRRGRLVIAISTGGASPAVSRKIREELEERYGDEYEHYLELLLEIRRVLQVRVHDPGTRRLLMKGLAEEDWLEECSRDPDKARERALAWIERQLKESVVKGGESHA